ncbi:MAG: response regulator [Cyanothece sp. SIO2G6]|nr:response regulator [Cyanothece sp. SIO2G6]
MVRFRSVQQGVDEIDQWISNHKASLGAIANSPTFRTMDWDIVEPYLRSEEKRLSGFNYLGMTNAAMLLYTTVTPEEKNGKIDLSDRQHIQNAIAGIDSISDPLLARSLDGARIVVFAIPTFSGEAIPDSPLGEVIGAINGVIDIDKVIEVVNGLEYGEGSYAFALNSKGEAIVHPNVELMSTIEKPALSLLEYGDPGLAEVAQRKLDQQAGLELLNIDGKNQYVAYAPLAEADWLVALVIPRQNIEDQLRPLNVMAMVVVGLTGTMLIVLWWVQAFEQEQLKRSKTAADMANQAKSEFLANMSHELRTPLNGILGYAQILGRTLQGKDRDGINVIYQCGSHLLTLINDILDLSKIEARKLELVPAALHLPSLLQSVVEICQLKAQQKGIIFLYQPSSNLPIGIEADEKRLRQVLINLLSNAIKFTEQGSVTLKVEVLNLTATHVSLLFQVIDTGIGIAQADIGKLFQAFEQVGSRKKQFEGTGLGLAISQRIVNLMESEIQLKSKFGAGSEFSFKVDFPIAKSWVEQQGILAGGDRIIGYEGNPQKILVIDDCWENRAVLSNLLFPLGFSMIEAENGAEGLELIRTEQPDLVITDLVMPVMDGFELLQQIRNTDDLKHAKVIVASASVAQADQRMALSHGGNDFLPKPIDAEELFQLLATHLKLSWIYEHKKEHISPSVDVDLVLPSKAVLESLLELALRDNVSALAAQVEQLMVKDAQYVPFAKPILQLAKQFQTEDIEVMLQDYLHNYSNEDLAHVE